MADLIDNSLKGKATKMLTYIARLGSNYVVIEGGDEKGNVRGLKKIPVNKYEPFESFLNNLKSKYPDKSAYGRTVVISTYDDWPYYSLVRITDPNWKWGSHNEYYVDINLKKISSRNITSKTYYQYELPETVVRHLIRNTESYYQSIQDMYYEYNDTIVRPAADAWIEEKKAQDEKEREEKKAKADRLASYTNYNPWDSAEESKSKKEKLFGPHWQELDAFNFSREGKSWEFFKKEYRDEIPNEEEAENYLNQMSSLFTQAKLMHDYGISYKPSNKEEPILNWYNV